jgi:arginine-tRNA-protein transferase
MEGFLGDRFGSTLVLDYLLGERLVAFGVLDVTPKAASSVYFVHDPDLASRRLGTFSVMQEVEWCRKTKRSHLYLGLWVRECPAMAYKAWFHPHETLVAGTWVREPLLQ